MLRRSGGGLTFPTWICRKGQLPENECEPHSDKDSLATLEKERDCDEWYVPYHPGRSPKDVEEMQARATWEEKQEKLATERHWRTIRWTAVVGIAAAIIGGTLQPIVSSYLLPRTPANEQQTAPNEPARTPVPAPSHVPGI